MIAERVTRQTAPVRGAMPTRDQAAEMAMAGMLSPDVVLEHLLDRIEGRPA